MFAWVGWMKMSYYVFEWGSCSPPTEGMGIPLLREPEGVRGGRPGGVAGVALPSCQRTFIVYVRILVVI